MSDQDDIYWADAYVVPEDDEFHPRPYFDRVIQYPEFEEIREGEAIVDFLLVRNEVIQAGRQILGRCHLPSVQGKLRELFQWFVWHQFGRIPDFLVTLDKDFWMGGTDRDREILMFHEMKHMEHAKDRDSEPRFNEEGRPVWVLRAHDIEEFRETVARYGAFSQDIRQFIEAAQQGGNRNG